MCLSPAQITGIVLFGVSLIGMLTVGVVIRHYERKSKRSNRLATTGNLSNVRA